MASIKPILKLTKDEASELYPRLWETFVEAFPEASEDEITKMISFATGVCHSCYENPVGCQCWNDD
jgi:hypothetical protein